MKLKLDQPIKDLTGKPIAVNDKPFTFKDVVGVVVNSMDPNHPMTAEKKLQAFQIGLRVFNKKLDEYDLTIDQISLLKELIGYTYNAVVYGRFLELVGDLKSDDEK